MPDVRPSVAHLAMLKVFFVPFLAASLLGCASSSPSPEALGHPETAVQAAVLAELLQQAPSTLVSLICIDHSDPSPALMNALGSLTPRSIRPCSAELSDIPPLEESPQVRRVVRFWVATIQFTAGGQARVTAGYVCGPLWGFGADFTLQRTAEDRWVITARTNLEEARTQFGSGLTPACSGLAALAADARR